MNDVTFSGSKSGSSTENAADSLFSRDFIEAIFAVSEGPIKGLKDNSLANYYVGDTPLYGPDNTPNFKKITFKLYKGVSNAPYIQAKLGGFGSSVNINTRLAYNTPVVRQTLKTDVNYLELRLVLQALYKETDKGTKEATAEIKVEIRKESESTYAPAIMYGQTQGSDDDSVTSVTSFDSDNATINYNGRQFRHWWQATAPSTTEINLYVKTGVTNLTPSELIEGDWRINGYSRHYFTWFNSSLTGSSKNRPYWLNRTLGTKKSRTVSGKTQYYYNPTYSWATVTGAELQTDAQNELKYWRWSTGGFFRDKSHLNSALEPQDERRVFFDVIDYDKDDYLQIGDLWLRDEARKDYILFWNGSAWVQPADADGTVPSSDQSSTTGIVNGVIKIHGKTTAPYVKEMRILVEEGHRYSLRVTKLTNDTDDKYKCEIVWESIQEIITDKMKFDNLAVVHVTGRATDQFSSIPDFSGILQGRVVRVPTNYDSTTREFTGVWDGTWKLSYTNNPAFIVKDLVENTRYGLSAYYPVSLNSWDVYNAGRWCDTEVPDGMGGVRPRITFNGLIAEARPTREAIEYICGTFGGRSPLTSSGITTSRSSSPIPN
jgi:hypothetical protein